MVDWLISKDKARNRPEALMLATGLLNEGFLQPAGDVSKEGVEGGAVSTVLDEPNALYYFVSDGLIVFVSHVAVSVYIFFHIC